MSLITETKKLRELEQKDDKSTLGWMLLDRAPTMLSVLECFQEGDADVLDELLSDWVYDEKHPAVNVLNRLQKAASLMEQDGDKCEEMPGVDWE